MTEKSFASAFASIDAFLKMPLRVLLFEELSDEVIFNLLRSACFKLEVTHSWEEFQQLLKQNKYEMIIVSCLDDLIAYQEVRNCQPDCPYMAIYDENSHQEINIALLQDELADTVPRVQIQQLIPKVFRLIKVSRQLMLVKEWEALLSGVEELSSRHPEVLEILKDLVTIKPMDDSEEYYLSEIDLLKAVLQTEKETNAESRLLRLAKSAVALTHSYEFKGLLDPSGIMWETNRGPLKNIGMKRDDIIGRPFWETPWFSGLTEGKELEKEKIKQAANGEFVRYDHNILGPNQEPLIVDGNRNPIKDRNGQVVFMTVEGRDVTEQRRLEREVVRQKEELSQLDKLKTQFFANISHEFRTPLTLILGPVKEVLSELDTADKTTQRERLEVVQRNALRLLRMVNQLLDFSAIEAGRIKAAFRPTDLSALTADLASMFRSAIEKAGVVLEVDCPALPESVYIDRDMWEKIVLNLISNAFKHTFEGKINVRLFWAEDQVKLTLQDTGVGIPTEQLPKLFERFYRIPESRSRTHEGSGIGLALVHELVELHGGRITVDSTINQGTIFTVSIPAGKAHLPPEQIQTETELETILPKAQAFIEEAMSWLPQQGSGKTAVGQEQEMAWYKTTGGGKVRVLLAEDNMDMRCYIERLLAPYCEVEAVPDGKAALEAALRRPPDLVLSDIMMPRMDGMQLLSALRQDASLRTVPVVLLSARAGEEAKVEGLQKGADDYLIKPFNKEELLARVKANLNLELQSARHQAEQEKRYSERLLKTVTDNAASALFMMDAEGYATFMNPAGGDMFGYHSIEELKNKTLHEWFHSMHPDGTPYSAQECPINRLMREQGGLRNHEDIFIRKDGTFFPVLVSAEPIFWEGQPMGTVVEVLDITQEKQSKEALLQYAKRLEQSNKELEHFATIASHDLQEPLRKILLFTDHLQKIEKQALSAEGKNDLDRILLATDKMQRLINDLLDLSRITRRGKPFQKMDLRTVAREVIAELSYSYPAIHSRIEVHGDMTIEADSNQMHQMLAQLADNALKFCKPDRPSHVNIQLQPAENQCQITITDNGIGMQTEYLHKIFDTFTRFQGVAYPGTGIGLALVKKIVDRHHGTIEVESVLGGGSCFIVRLPAMQK